MRITIIHILFFVLFIIILGCSQRDNQDTNSNSINKTIKDSSASVRSDTINYEKTDLVLGQWKRPDGGYILEIKTFNSGSFEASYYNPKSIYISETQWKIQEGYVYLFVKFDDEGYPGSYYSLGYYPDKDLLVGFYHQAVIQQNFEVYFERMK